LTAMLVNKNVDLNQLTRICEEYVYFINYHFLSICDNLKY
jgi:hypothetical protein